MCCGFGGTFSVRLPDLAIAMADDKIDQTEATGAAIVLTGDTGCLMHVGRAHVPPRFDRSADAPGDVPGGRRRPRRPLGP